MTIVKLIKIIEARLRRYHCRKNIDKIRSMKDEIIRCSENGYRISAEELGISKEKYDEGSEVVIGEFDQDGFILSYVGNLKGFPTTTEEDYMKRERFKIFLVIKDGYLAIRKHYCNNELSFLNELKVLHILSNSNLNVPSILDINFEELTITQSYIHGKVLREEMAKQGAKIRDRQIGKNSDYPRSERRKLVKQRLDEGKRFLNSIVDKDFIINVNALIRNIHSKGIIINDIKYGNIIIDHVDKKPFIIDFESSWVFEKQNTWKFRLLLKHEKMLISKHFD
ncbi:MULTISPECIES: hypothetical protein [Bacillaceae]|uniref:Protein kinase domain-containing protein n=1 Tax=Evansella alkalicola TaxID=745819 RepID=A0ABS6JWW8_9BACI|nr:MULTISPECIES: hypothetical protein [Bacillaceae]MBU9723084.1 hypothetical protein [Bacillus alkalicola]